MNKRLSCPACGSWIPVEPTKQILEKLLEEPTLDVDSSAVDHCPRCQARLAEEAEAFWRELRAYDGDEYIVEAEMSGGMSREDAIKEAQDLKSLRSYLDPDGLAMILKDRRASQALANALIDEDAGVRHALYQFALFRKPRGVPGRKPHWKPKYSEFKDQGQSYRDIAKWRYGDQGPEMNQRNAEKIASVLTRKPKPRRKK